MKYRKYKMSSTTTNLHIKYLEKWGKNVNNISPTDFDVCLYHMGCPDGIGASFPFYRLTKKKGLIFHGVKHDEDPPWNLIEGKNVVIVDFSYDKNTISKICGIVKHIVILDHHDSTFRDLQGIENKYSNIGYIIDLDRSAAQIAWNWCYSFIDKYVPIPWFINIIADRDLWKWKIRNSREIGKALYHFGWYTWEKMEELYNSNIKESKLKGIFANQGTALLEMEDKSIHYSILHSVLCEFQGYRVRITACNPKYRSEVGSKLAAKKDCDFAVIWRYSFKNDQWWLSLRSTKDCIIPINKIIEKWGGGGHFNACGFTIHGTNSKEWRDASTTERKKMAHGNMWNYFKLLKKK